ncbi:MAG: DNA repair protein RadC [Bacteroidaceae bacterium]|nr:DNA repair protein RadC [Bacteroidaceae bacterium]MBQ4526314.1 DNA repair protein RadC [Bacteroidaceae bacterium]
MNAEKLNINQWAEEDRPREKMMAHGARVLTDAELLAILIGSGSQDETAVELMRRVLSACNNNLNELAKLSLEQLCRFKGIGPAKAVTVMAACELGHRRKLAEVEERLVVRTARDLYNHFHPKLADQPVEEFWVMLLNNACRVIDSRCVATGGITEVAVDVRLVLREAILGRATAIALCHNHPSGNVRPSRQDDLLTDRLRQACDLMNIRLMDHIVLTDGRFYSYADEGRL